jgi:hypothetical protein
MCDHKNHTFYIRSLYRGSIAVDLGANVVGFACAVATELGITCYAVEAIQSIVDQIPILPQLKNTTLRYRIETDHCNYLFRGIENVTVLNRSVAEEYGTQGIEICSG